MKKFTSVQLTPIQIETWISKNFKYKKVSGGRQIRINNPFHEDSDYHFWISLYETELKNGPLKGTKGYWVHDYRPGIYASSFLGFVKKFRNLSYHQALSEVTGKTSIELRAQLRYNLREEKEEEKKEDIEFVELPEGSVPLTGSKDCLARQIALNYLYNRMIDDELIEKYKLHFTVSSIVFPYYEYGCLSFWQQRDILNKVFNFPDSEKTGLNKTDYVFGFDYVEPHSDLRVVESIFNSMTVGDNCIASGGAILAGKQKQLIKALRPKRLVWCPDRDKAGVASLIKNYFEFKDDFPMAYCLPPNPINDWNEMEQKQGKGSARQFIEQNTKNLNLSDIIRFKMMVNK